MARPADQQRNVNAAVISPSLGARQSTSVVAKEKDDGVVHDSLPLQFTQDVADLVVCCGDQVIIAGHIAPHFRRVRIVRGQGRMGGIVAVFSSQPHDFRFELLLWRSDAAFVGGDQVDAGKERFPRNAFHPILRQIKGRVGKVEVEIGLPRPGNKVAGLPQVAGKGGGRRHQFRAHVVRAKRRGIQPADQPRSARGADRRVGKRSGESCALAGQLVQIRCPRVAIIVAAQFRTCVLPDDPNDVRTVWDKRRPPQKHPHERKQYPRE